MRPRRRAAAGAAGAASGVGFCFCWRADGLTRPRAPCAPASLVASGTALSLSLILLRILRRFLHRFLLRILLSHLLVRAAEHSTDTTPHTRTSIVLVRALLFQFLSRNESQSLSTLLWAFRRPFALPYSLRITAAAAAAAVAAASPLFASAPRNAKQSECVIHVLHTCRIHLAVAGFIISSILCLCVGAIRPELISLSPRCSSLQILSRSFAKQSPTSTIQFSTNTLQCCTYYISFEISTWCLSILPPQSSASSAEC